MIADRTQNPVIQKLTAKTVEEAWLGESVRIRAQQTRSAILSASIVAIILTVVLTPYLSLLVVGPWVLSFLATLFWRYQISSRILTDYETRSLKELEQADRRLRLCSILTQFTVGAGIFLCWGYESIIAAYIITAAQILHGMGSMINLSYDYRSFEYSLPMLVLPPFVFWVLYDGPGSTIVAASIVFLSFLMLNLVRRSEASLRETLKMRFENVRLLEEVEDARAKTQDALEIAQKANQTRSFFMAAASHDLRQPLFALSILTDTLGLQALPDSARPIYDKQRSAIKALRSLFDNLLDLSKFDSGQIDSTPTDIPLENLLKPIDEEFAVICEKRQISWSLEYPKIAVYTDQDLLLRVIRNLLTNATNFTDEGGVSLKVGFNNGKALFEVADTGCGISEADQERVFDDFVQLNNSNRLRTKGVGLGLAITKHINQLLGLKLKMTSRLGQGTTFRFECPASLLMQPVKQEAQAPAQLSADTIAGTRLWVFEDEPLVRGALAHQFAAWSCEAELFSSRRDYQERKGEFQDFPDLVILDDMLSHDESGLDLALELEPRMGAKRILIMTGNSELERLQVLDESPFIYAKKPISVEWLIYWITTASRAPRPGMPIMEKS